MASVGLLYVGAVLFVNGVMLLGHVSPRAVAPLNFFVGALQVLTPTYLIIAADGDPAAIALAAGLYFFGFTYLWVGLNAATGWPNDGLGWFSLTVTVAGVVFAVYSWTVVGDRAFTVLWLLWAVLWFAFFVLMALRRDHLGPAVGVLAASYGVLTTGGPGLLLLGGWWEDSALLALVLAALGLLMVPLSFPLSRVLSARPTPPQPAGTAAADERKAHA
ncbi:MAG TPA: AmiS/UreI family transporter [Phototrophicaceae bacterium]|nr:AmiS/UreI family transporter [Phototrophicaceae bacterium]